MITLAPAAADTAARQERRLHDAGWRAEIERVRGLRDALEAAHALGTVAEPEVLRAANEWSAEKPSAYDLDLDLLRAHLTSLLAHQVPLLLAEGDRLRGLLADRDA